MRMLRPALIAGAVVLVLAGATALPLWAAPAPTTVGPRPVPAELADRLYRECVEGIMELADDEYLAPQLTADSHLNVTLGRIDNYGVLIPSPPDDERQPQVDEYNLCFRDYEFDPAYRGEPSLAGLDQREAYNHLMRVVVPCLETFGVDVELPSKLWFEQGNVLPWYLEQLEQLSFADAADAWWACPLVPESLSAAAFPENPPQGG